MAQSLSNIILHLVFSTKQRREMIGPRVLKDLHAYLAGTCRALGSPAFRVGGTSNHVHIACSLSRTMTVSQLLEKMKSSSSAWMKSNKGGCPDFAWQSGYGAFSAGASQIEALVQYIDNQHDHHRAVSFEQEVLDLLHRYAVPYDERYLWD